MFCTRCGKESESGMMFCTGCGAPLSPGEKGQDAFQQPVGGQPIPDQDTLVRGPAPMGKRAEGPSSSASGRGAWWVLVAAAVIVALVVGAVTGILVMRSHGDDSAGPSGTTTSLSAELPASTTTTPEPTTTTAAAPVTSTTSTTISQAASDDWPEFDGWTVIVESLDVADPTSESTARAHAADMVARGIEAGVLYSSGYGSLNPGYWAVFSGVYDTREQARSHMDWLIDNGYPYAYERQVTR